MSISDIFYILTVQRQDDAETFDRLVEWVNDNHFDDQPEVDDDGQLTLAFFSDDFPYAYCQRLSARFPGLEFKLHDEFSTIATFVNGGELVKAVAS